MSSKIDGLPLGTDEWHCQQCGGLLSDGKCPLCPDEMEVFADAQGRWNLVVLVWLIVLTLAVAALGWLAWVR